MKISFKWTLCCLGNFANYYFILFQNCQQLEISFRKKKTLLFFLQLRHLFFSVYAIELIPLEKETHPPTVVLFWFNYGNKVTKSKIGEIVTSFPQYTTGNMFLSGLNFCYKIITNFFFFFNYDSNLNVLNLLLWPLINCLVFVIWGWRRILNFCSCC